MLNRFIKTSNSCRPAITGLFLLLALGAAVPAKASVPTAVATSTAAYVSSSSFGYVNKVVVDPYGNVFASDSSNGVLWEIPAGTSTPIRINNFPLFATVTAKGSGYTTAPTITIDPPSAGGVQATATATISGGQVTAITINNHGSGYNTAPHVTVGAAPAGGTTATATATISLNVPHGFTIDSYGDIVISNPSSGGSLYFFPNINGQLCTSCNALGNEPLDLSGTYGYSTLTDYFATIGDFAADSNGNLYVAATHCNNAGQACGLSNDSIFLIPNINPQTTAASIGKAANGATLFQGALPGGKPVLNMALDSSGKNLYYVDGVNAYVVSTASANLTPVTIGTGFKAPSGISLDPAGNLYIVDNSQKLLYEIPNENGKLNAADQFVVTAMTNPYYSVGFDHAGNIYQADGTDKVINKITLGALNLASTAVGGTPVTASVSFRFNGSVTPSAFSLVQGLGGSGEFTRAATSTCVAGTNYTSGQNCVEAVTFTPSSTGTRQGAVVMQSAAGKAIATAYLSGIGTGAALTVDPGTQVSLTPTLAFSAPSSVALDAAGNFYVADMGTNSVQVISAAGAGIASIGSGLSAPGGVAVDGAGDVFIADTGNSRIVEVPNEAGKLNTADQSVLGFVGLTSPTGIAVDPAGALYVADTGNARIVRMSTYEPSGTPTQSTIGSGYTKPVAVTTDDIGNVYVADVTAGQIVGINMLSYAQTVVLGQLISPTSVALDAAADLYVVQSGNGGTVEMFPNIGGVLNTSGELSLGTGLKSPIGLAVNGGGTLAIADAGLPAAFSVKRTAGSLNFGSWNKTLTSDAQILTLTSAGTAALQLGAVPYVASGNTADFTVSSLGSTGCSGGLSISVGAICEYSAVFAPVATGPLAETLTFSSNAVNASPGSASLSGTGTNLAFTNTTLVQTLPATGIPQYGQAVLLTATISTQVAGGTAPTGTVQFLVDGFPAGNPVVLPPSLTVTLSFPAFSLTAGIHSVTAAYSGDTLNSASDKLLVLQVTRQTSVITPIVYPLVAQPSGSSFTLSAGVAATLPLLPGGKLPTGTVSFEAAGSSVVLATATLGNNGTAVFPSFTPPASGQYVLVYAGDANYSGSGVTFSVSIRSPTFDVSIPASGYTLAGGQSVVVPITVTWISGYTGNIGLGAVNLVTNVITPACSGLPQYVTCVFSPGLLQLPTPDLYPASNPTAIMNLTLASNVPPATPYPVPAAVLWPTGLGLLLLSLLPGRRRGRALLRLRMLVMAVFACGIMAALNGCGTTVNSAYQTPKGNSSFTVTFSGSPAVGVVSTTNPNITDTLSVQLTVQ